MMRAGLLAVMIALLSSWAAAQQQQQQQPPVPPPTLFPGQPPQSDPTRLTSEQLFREIGTLEKSINSQLASIIKNADEFKANLTHFPTEVDQKLAQSSKLQEELVKGHVARIAEQFSGIKLQFDERDKRTELLAAGLKDALNQAALAQTTAVNAALQAQKESASTQYSNLASSLSELKATFSKLLDAQQGQLALVKDDGSKAIASLKDDTNRSIATLTNQVTAITAHSTGIGDSWVVILGGGMLLIAVAGLFITYNRGSSTHVERRTVYVPPSAQPPGSTIVQERT